MRRDEFEMAQLERAAAFVAKHVPADEPSVRNLFMCVQCCDQARLGAADPQTGAAAEISHHLARWTPTRVHHRGGVLADDPGQSRT